MTSVVNVMRVQNGFLINIVPVVAQKWIWRYRMTDKRTIEVLLRAAYQIRYPNGKEADDIHILSQQKLDRYNAF